MSLELGKLNECSFRGIRFLFRQGTTEYGRKNVSHEFVNQDRRFVEDLGELKEKYEVTGVITGPNYFEKRDALARALKTAGPGQLVHPFYGTRMVAVKSVNVVEDTKRLGEATFNIVFEETIETPVFPQATTAPAAAILQSVDRANIDVSEWIGDTWNVSRQFPANAIDGEQLLEEVVDRFSTAIIDVATGNATSAFKTLLENFSKDSVGLVTNSAQLGTRYVELFDEYQLLAATPEEQFALNESLYTFGDDDVLLNELTFERVERNRNTNVINTNGQALALINNYQQVAQQSFFDENALNTARNNLENQYLKVAEAPELAPNIREELQVSRNITREFFEQQDATAFRVSDVETNPTPMTVLAYQYYGDLDFVDQLLELNDVRYPSSVDGTVQVFTR